jgi:uncharacterized repeat protein (TIGR03803 family)
VKAVTRYTKRGGATRRRLTLLAAIAVTALSICHGAQAYTFKQFYDFCQGNSCDGGDYPDGSLIIDSSGNLYAGATSSIKLSPPKTGTKWTWQRLFSAGDPGLIDAKGAVYGLTVPGKGGANGFGYIFKLTPNANKTKWTEANLYSFCSQSDCTDGQTPNPGLVMDGSGDIYGTTERGGAFCHKQVGCGTAFMLTQRNGKWTHSVIHSFFDLAVKNDGAEPTANVIVGSPGHLYGTTSTGGANGKGTVFELTANADKTIWTETVLYSFCAKAKCADGDTPYGGVIMDKTGRLYGTTNVGGRNDGGNTGTVFMLTPNADKTKWTETVIHKFCASGECASDGTEPSAGLIMDGAGNLYGMTPEGGSKGSGVVYELTPNAGKTKWTEKILRNFCLEPGCSDGAQPQGALVSDKSGDLFGTTEYGGNFSNGGTAFELLK